MIRITPENHHEYNISNEYGSHHPRWKECLNANMSLNEYLEQQIDPNSETGVNWDVGGDYNGWLRGFGIEPNTQNGWWSKAAVMPDNLELYILEMTTDANGEIHEILHEARNIIANARKAGRFISNHKTVKETVFAMTGKELEATDET